MRRPSFDRIDLFAIGLAGVVGAAVRWRVTRSDLEGEWFTYAPNTGATFTYDLKLPTEVVVINLIGCLLLGALTVLIARNAPGRRRLLLAASVGFCGSLTTFSTFATDTASLLGARGDGDLSVAATYLLLSLVGGGFAFWLGRVVIRRVEP